MATTRKTKAAVAETSDEVTAAPAKEFNPGDLILCRSTTVGELLCPAVKSGGLYRASGYGDLIHMQYQDLLALKLRKSQYIYAPLFVVEDEDLLATPIWADVKAIYDKMFEEEDLDEFFKMTPAKIKSALKNAPKGFQNAVRVRAATKIADGSLDSMNRIKAIDEVLGTDLMNMM